MDYSICWAYIVKEMEKKGFRPDSTEMHEMAFFEEKMRKIWNEYFNKCYEMEHAFLKNMEDGEA